MNFIEAIAAVREGHRVRRPFWKHGFIEKVDGLWNSTCVTFQDAFADDYEICDETVEEA